MWPGLTFGVLSELTYNERNALAELPAGTTISGNQVDVLEGNYRTQVNSAYVWRYCWGLGLQPAVSRPLWCGRINPSYNLKFIVD